MTILPYSASLGKRLIANVELPQDPGNAFAWNMRRIYNRLDTFRETWMSQ